jgi:hypothetical protein
MPNLDNLPSDIYDLLKGKTIGDPSVLEKFGPELGKVLQAKLASKAEERVPTLRMSNIGRPLRQLWYELNGYKSEEIEGKTQLKFLYGDLIEALVLVLAEASGHDVSRFQEEIIVDGIVGHIDAVIDGELVDIKSASPFGYSKFENGELFTNDTFGYVGQISGYAHALNLPARFVAVNKVLGGICTLKVPQSIIDNYDIKTRIEKAKVSIAAKEIPERCYEDEPYQKSGNRKLSTGCYFCGFKQECWKDSNDGQGLKTYLYSNGPVFLTTVVKEPRVFQTNEN